MPTPVSILDAPRIAEYSPVASVGPFPVPFPLFTADGSDLVVELGDAVELTGWTITSDVAPGFFGAPNTWINAEVTLASPVTGGLKLIGRRAPRRPEQFAEGRGTPARDLNTELNILTAAQREIYDWLVALAPIIRERPLQQLATPLLDGLMRSLDKAKLDGVAVGAQVNRQQATVSEARIGESTTTDTSPARVASVLQDAIGGLPPKAPGEILFPVPILERRHSPWAHGLRPGLGQTRAQRTAAYQATLDWCASEEGGFCEAEFPPGSWEVDRLYTQVGIDCRGEFVGVNSGLLYTDSGHDSDNPYPTPSDTLLTVLPDPNDVQVLTAAWMNALVNNVNDPLKPGDTRKAALATYMGCTISWVVGASVQNFLTRFGATLAYKGCLVVLEEDDYTTDHLGNSIADPARHRIQQGAFEPRIIRAPSGSWSDVDPGSRHIRAVCNRKPIVIEGFKAILQASADTGARGGIVFSRRPNVTFKGGYAINESGRYVNQIAYLEGVSGNTFEDFRFEGALGAIYGVQYGLNIDRCHNTHVVRCVGRRNRRDIDMHGSTDTMIQGDFENGVGSHWHDRLTIMPGSIISSRQPNGAPIQVAGSDTTICKGVTLNVSADQGAAILIRGDIPYHEGVVKCEADIVVDLSLNKTAPRMLFDYGPNVPQFEWGRRLRMPDLIDLSGSRIKFVHAEGFENNFHLVRILPAAGEWRKQTGTTPGGDPIYEAWRDDEPAILGNGVSGSGLINVEDIQITGADITPWITIFKQPQWRAGGYRVSASGLDKLVLYAICSASHDLPAVARSDFDIKNVRTFTPRLGFGAFRRATWECDTQTSATRANRPGGYATAIGDETEHRDTVLYRVFAWDPPSVNSGASVSTTVNVPGAAGGDTVSVNLSTGGAGLQAGMLITGSVTSADTVTVSLLNLTGGAVNLVTSTVYITVRKD